MLNEIKLHSIKVTSQFRRDYRSMIIGSVLIINLSMSYKLRNSSLNYLKSNFMHYRFTFVYVAVTQVFNRIKVKCQHK